MYCIKCGTQIPDEGQFCPKCGTKILSNHQEEIRRDNYAQPIKMSTKKKGLIIGSVLAAIFLTVIIVFLLSRSPIAGKWYDMNDDDFWLDIGNKTITVRDVFNDEVYGTIEYTYSKDSKKITTGTIGTGSKSRKFVEDVAEMLSRQEVYVEDSILYVMGLDGRKKVVNYKFSSDSSYKRDH